MFLIVKSLIDQLTNLHKNIHFLWVPSHIGILGNGIADDLTTSTKIFLSKVTLP